MSTLGRLVLALVALGALPGLGAAQARSSLEIAPRVGVVIPANELGRGVRLDDGNFLAFGRMQPTAMFGASVQLGWESSLWAARATVLQSLDSEVTATWDCVGGWNPGRVCPEPLIRQEAKGTVTAAVVGAVRYVSPVWGERLHPFASLGAGAKRYTFRWSGRQGGWGAFSGGNDSLTDIALQVGIGVVGALPGVSVVAEAENYVSWFGPGERERPDGSAAVNIPEGESHLVHDLSLSIGAKVRLF